MSIKIKQLTIMLIALLSVTLTSCSSLPVNLPDNAHSIDNTITLAQVSQDVSFLASDELQGRGNFSPNIVTAANYIAKRFNDVGLKPLSNKLGFKQEYSLQHIIPDSLTVEINGTSIAQDSLAMVTTVANFQWHSNLTKPRATTKLNPSVSLSPSVKTVFIGENVNMRKALRALNNQGGEHLVLLHPRHKKSFKRYQSHFAKGLTKLVTNNEMNSKPGGVIVIALTDIANVKQYQVTGSASVHKTHLSNVVGILPGKTKTNEIVVYSAHYDHLGTKNNSLDKAARTTDIYNGADDDASGVTAIIHLAKHFAKTANNERTLMFAAFSAEELGNFGSRYFAEQLSAADITAMINIEMIGKPAIFGEGTVWMTGMERSNLGEQLNQTLVASGMKIYADPYPNEKLFYRSDNATLARLGVPAHSFSSAQIDKDPHYHQVSDDINSLNIPSMLQVIKTLANATTPLIDGSISPSRIKPNKEKRTGKIY